MSIEQEIKRLLKRKSAFLEASIKDLDKNIKDIQKKLLELIFAEYMDKFDIVDGKLADTTKNFRLIAEMDKVYDDFAKTYQNEIVKGFGKDITRLTIVTGEYYRNIGVTAKTVKNIAEKLKYIDQSIGVRDGKIIKGSYLDRLAQSQEVRQKLKNYVTSSIVEGKGYTSYKQGMKELVVGKRGVDGSLEGYWKQYAHDSYYQVENAKSAFFADQVGFNYFYYFGVIITTSRDFCIKRAGKVFSREDAERDWKCDPTLLRRKGVTGCDETYNYAVEVGRWNCQHTLGWIDEEAAMQVGVSKINI